MTGELTLRGNVLPVGGIKEKVLAARRSGIRTLVLPEANRRNLEEIPKSLRRDVQFIFVKHVSEVFEVALIQAERAPRPAQTTLNRDLPTTEACCS
jgi:ATP-dependent Lon protease